MFTTMKISLAQIQSIPGDIRKNIDHHKRWIDAAAAYQSDLIVFPELSITNYEPTMVKDLAVQLDDERLEIFQQLSNRYNMTIAIGLPLQVANGITISMLIFQPGGARQLYNKKYLHADEIPFFVPGENQSVTLDRFPSIAPAICYEISVSDHVAMAAAQKAEFYLASVVKFRSGLAGASEQLSNIARTYGMTVLMANAVGEADGGLSGGNSSVWAPDGKLIGQLSQTEEGLLLYHTATRQTQKIIVNDIATDRTHPPGSGLFK